MLKYSVIIPVYNAEKTLGRCLDSLISQEREDIEFIAVNDGSTDDSEKILTEYCNRSNSLKFISQTNAGVSAARNAGVELAQGEYILFVDSDDYVAEDYFSQIDLFGTEDLCVFPREAISSKVSDHEFFKNFNMDRELTKIAVSLIAGKKMMPPWNKRFKREIIEKYHIRFCPDFSIAEDLDFCMAYLMHCSSINISDHVLYYLEVSGQDSLSRKYRPELYKKLKKVYSNIEVTVLNNENNNLNRRAILTAVDYLYTRSAFSSTSEEQKRKGSGYFKNRKLYKKICESFETRICDNENYLNRIHHLMRFLIERKMTFSIYLISGLVKKAKHNCRGSLWAKLKF